MSRYNIQKAWQNNTEQIPAIQSSNQICYKNCYAARTDEAIIAARFIAVKLKEGIQSFVLQLLKTWQYIVKWRCFCYSDANKKGQTKLCPKCPLMSNLSQRSPPQPQKSLPSLRKSFSRVYNSILL